MADDMSVEQKIDLLVERFGVVARKVDALDQRFDAIDGRLDGMDHRFDGLDQRFDAIDGRLDVMDHRFDALDQRVDAMDLKFSVQFDAVRADIRLVAEGAAATNERLDRVAAEARDHHDKQYQLLGEVVHDVRVRVERLEGARRRK